MQTTVELKAKKAARHLLHREEDNERMRIYDASRKDDPVRKAKKAASGRARYIANPEKAYEQGKSWAIANPEKKNASHRAWVLRNPEQAKESDRRWTAENPEKVRAKNAKYAGEHPERKKELRDGWNLANPDKVRIMAGRAHAKRKRSLGFVPLNSYFVGSEGHHINSNDVIFIPKTMHRSIAHNVFTGRNMDKMNALAGQYLTEDWT